MQAVSDKKRHLNATSGAVWEPHPVAAFLDQVEAQSRMPSRPRQDGQLGGRGRGTVLPMHVRQQVGRMLGWQCGDEYHACHKLIGHQPGSWRLQLEREKRERDDRLAPAHGGLRALHGGARGREPPTARLVREPLDAREPLGISDRAAGRPRRLGPRHWLGGCGGATRRSQRQCGNEHQHSLASIWAFTRGICAVAAVWNPGCDGGWQWQIYVLRHGNAPSMQGCTAALGASPKRSLIIGVGVGLHTPRAHGTEPSADKGDRITGQYDASCQDSHLPRAFEVINTTAIVECESEHVHTDVLPSGGIHSGTSLGPRSPW
mmetsp:Transcript_385/g.1662  ORF Transcript_385/g.1662 Transcript_385/m.1662 type:complete len:318 (-) Transcript_385:671-1624(-)